MLVRLLPLLAGLLPLLAAYLAFGIGVIADVLPPCIPFIDGCASISATGRNPPGSYLFRAIMLPHAIFLLMTWYFAVLWIRALDPSARRSTMSGIHISGIVSAIALILYVTFLGTTEPFYELMRRFGIYLFFLAMAVAELLVVLALLRAPRVVGDAAMKRMAQVMLILCLLPFALGVLNLYLKAKLADADVSENVIEWIAATLMHGYLIVMYFMWRSSGFTVAATTGSR